ncbi:MAG TPA: serine protease [Bacteroidales bacterium]|nr:serine protease [Bacteroidales bacterium]HBZ67060.1 serine protease [Bacteroidales bacterium]
MEFLSQLDPMLRMFWYIAIPVSVVFAIQTITTFIGMDSTDGAVADFDSNLDGDSGIPFQLFSLRNLVNFLLGFGWGGVSFYNTFESKSIVIILALISGIVLIAVFFFVMQQMSRLNEDNTMKPKDSLGKTAEVYLTVPELGSGTGKVLVSIKGSMHEMTAITRGTQIPSGSLVKITAVESGEILVVEKI